MRRGNAANMNLNCGDHVCDASDPRHVGRVEYLHRGDAKVRWDTGWYSTIPVQNLRIVETVDG